MEWPSRTPPFGQDRFPYPNPNLYPPEANCDYYQGPPPSNPPWARQHNGASDAASVYNSNQYYPPELGPPEESGIHHEFQGRSFGFNDPQHNSNDFGGHAIPSQPLEEFGIHHEFQSRRFSFNDSQHNSNDFSGHAIPSSKPNFVHLPPNPSSDNCPNNFSSPHGFPGSMNPSTPSLPLDFPPAYPSAPNASPPWSAFGMMPHPHIPPSQGHIPDKPSGQGYIPPSQGQIPSQPNFLDGDAGVLFGYKPPSVHPLLQSVSDDVVPYEEENDIDGEEEKAKRAEDTKFNYSHLALEKFGMNVTTRAKEGALSPVHGRDLVVRQCIEILTRKNKCNPVLVGHPGVGKTAIVEGLAQRIVKGNVPEPLRRCKIISVDFQSVLADTSMRGQFEANMKKLIDEATAGKRKVILFFDELHRVIGAGKCTESADSASENLKPALARGDFLCIGATTFDEYTKYVEKDQAFARRFQKVVVDPPSVEDTISILRGLRPSLEAHHGISIADDALIQAVKLSERYIPDRYLPDKAIDLVDVSASKVKIGLLSKSPISDDIDRAILELDMERLGITPATSQASHERLQQVHSDLEGLKARQANLDRKWKKEKTLATRVVSLREKINALKNQSGIKPVGKPNRNNFATVDTHDYENDVHSFAFCHSCLKHPITGPRYNHQTQNSDLCGACYKALQFPPGEFHLVKPPRLTCAGCATHPIFGTFYLNIQITDSVLCESCFGRANGGQLGTDGRYVMMHNNLLRSDCVTEKSSNLQELEAQLALAEEWKEYERCYKPFIQVEVSSAAIAEVLSEKTGIPVSKLQASQKEQLLQLDAELHKRVIGQDEACNAIARAIQRSRAGLSDPKRPIASFMFMGPTGVGKTELAKALAVELFNSEEAMVRIDMSEYGEKCEVSRLTGAAPGLIGHGDGGQLTTPVRRKPYTVVLFDEIEKADDEIFNVFLQILDDGRLTDSEGRVVNFTNTVIIMTSNVGADAITGVALNSEAGAYGSMDEQYQDMKSRVMDAVRDKYRPEFVNRIDEFVIFQPLNRQQIREIVKLQLERVSQRLQDRQIKFRVSESALQLLSAMGYDPRYGARPVKRAIQQSIEDPLAQGILRGHYPEGCTIMIDTENSASDEEPSDHQKLIFYKMP